MFDSLVGLLSGAWWSYPLLAGVCLADAVLPVMPSEASLITCGITAGTGGLVLPLVVLAAFVGAWLGDNLSYTIGDSAEGWARRWVVRGEKGRRGLAWAERALDRHGGSLLVVARFVPGGRTVTTIGCGVLGYPRTLFMTYDAVGALVWSLVNALTGYLGGQAFADRTYAAFAVSFGVAAAVAVAIEVVRRLRARRTT